MMKGYQIQYGTSIMMIGSKHMLPLMQNSRNYTTSMKQQNPTLLLQFQRYNKNVSRLYARRMLDAMTASIIAYHTILKTKFENNNTKCEEVQVVVPSKPRDWIQWKRHDFTNVMYETLGNTWYERMYNAYIRMIQLSILVSPLILLYPLKYISKSLHTTITWPYMIWCIESAGPTYIKLIQWATTRQDLFSYEFCQYFGKLRQDTVGHTFHETCTILKEELGNDIIITNNKNDLQLLNQQQNATTDKKKMIYMNPKPIGSGCIAQVYKGVLLYDIDNNKFKKGTEIAIKVQHPNIYYKVCSDFYICSIIATLLEAIPYINLQYLSLYDTIIQFQNIMLPQLNLLIESNNLTRFINDFNDDEHVTFPIPIPQLTTSKVLIETYIHGKPIMEYITYPTIDRKELALLGLRTTLKMIFVHDFLHGDLHPGNILVSGATGNYKLHLLDCGLVVEMGPDQHVNLVKILGAFTRKNGALAGRLMVDTQSTKKNDDGNDEIRQSNPEDVDLFVKGIEQIILDDVNQNFIEKVGDYIIEICYLACQNKVKLEPAFINAALAVEIIEGIATALDPTLIVTKTAMPMVVQAEMMHRLPKFSLW